MASPKKAAKVTNIKIQMIGSLIGCPRTQRETVRGLGLRHIRQIVERPDTPEIRGMVRKVPHLVAIVQDAGNAVAQRGIGA